MQLQHLHVLDNSTFFIRQSKPWFQLLLMLADLQSTPGRHELCYHPHLSQLWSLSLSRVSAPVWAEGLGHNTVPCYQSADRPVTGECRAGYHVFSRPTCTCRLVTSPQSDCDYRNMRIVRDLLKPKTQNKNKPQKAKQICTGLN